MKPTFRFLQPLLLIVLLVDDVGRGDEKDTGISGVSKKSR